MRSTGLAQSFDTLARVTSDEPAVSIVEDAPPSTDNAESQTFDIVLATSSRAAAPVLVTVVGRYSADLMLGALTTATLHQCDGLKPYARPVDRGA